MPDHQGSIFFGLTTPPPKQKKISCWGKKLLKGDEKGENAYLFFPQLVKSMHIFPTIDLKFTKLQKRLEIFRLRRAAAHILINFLWEKNVNQEKGWEQKYEFHI